MLAAPLLPDRRSMPSKCPLPFRLGSGFHTGMDTNLQVIIRRALAEAKVAGKDYLTLYE